MSPVGLTKDAGWQIGVSRTVPHDLDEVWTTLLSPAGLALWLGPGAALGDEPGDPWSATDGARGELRSLRPGDRVRVLHRPPGRDADTVVQLVVRPAAGGGTSVRLHQERLADADEREAMRAHWAAVHDRLRALLGA